MEMTHGVSFGPYRLAGPHGPLLRRSKEVTIPPKALAVLWALVSRAGSVVTKEELLSTVWEGTVVGDEALTSCLRRLRRALHEDAEQPRYIATVHRIGYRFIATVASSQYPVVSREESQTGSGKSPEQNEGLRLEANGQGLESSIQSLESAEQRPIVVGRTSDLRDGPTPSPQRVWSSRNVALAGVVLLRGLIAGVQYLSQPSLSTQDWSVPAPATPG